MSEKDGVWQAFRLIGLSTADASLPTHRRSCLVATQTKTDDPVSTQENSSLTFTAANPLFPSETCSSQVCICQHTIYQVHPCSVNLSRKAPAITRPQEYEQVTRACFGLRPNSPFTNTDSVRACIRHSGSPPVDADHTARHHAFHLEADASVPFGLCVLYSVCFECSFFWGYLTQHKGIRQPINRIQRLTIHRVCTSNRKLGGQ